MTPKSADLKRTAVKQSLLDVDLMLKEANEHASLGINDVALSLYQKALKSLRERFAGDVKNIPVDVLVIRFRVLIQLSKLFSASGRHEEALKFAGDANQLASIALKDEVELLLISCTELTRLYIVASDLNSAKKIVARANKAPKGEDTGLCQALNSLGTGRLFFAFKKYDMAMNIIEKGLRALRKPKTRDHIEVKTDLYSLYVASLKAAGEKDKAETVRDEAVELLNKSGRIARDREEGTFDAIYYYTKALKVLSTAPDSELKIARISEVNLNLADILIVRGLWYVARKLLKETSDFYVDSTDHDPKNRILCWVGLGQLYIEMKRYEKAEDILYKSISFAENSKNIYCYCLANHYLGLCISKMGDDEKGVEKFEEALDFLQDVSDSREKFSLMARIYNQLGFIEAKKQNIEKAVEYLKNSVELLRPYTRDLALGEAYRMLGEIYSQRQQYMQSERTLKISLEIYEKKNARIEVARVYRSIGINFLSRGELDKATFFLDEAIEIFEKLGLDSDLPKLYSNKAQVCIMKEDYIAAEDLSKKDFEIAKKFDNKHSLAFSYYHLGRIRRLLKRTHSAEDFLKRSLALFEEVNNMDMAGHVMIELALCASERKDVKSATDYCAKTQKIFKRDKRNSPELAKLLVTRGIVLRTADRRQIARRCFEDALRMYDKLEMVVIDLAEAHFEFAMYWKGINDRKTATEHMRSAIDIAEKLGLGRKVDSYLQELNAFNPEEGSKLRLSQLMDKSAVEQFTSRKVKSGQLVVEKKHLTILFTDIRSFTMISETLSLDDMTSFLNDFYRNVTQVVMKFNGQINKFIGDAAMAIFNMDGQLDDHPVWAVRAALDLVRAMEETNHIRSKKGEMPIHVGIGINTGEVLLGAFGSGLRLDYTAIGDNVNIASRIQGQAGPGEIVISDATLEHVKDIVTVEDLGEKPLKGKGQPLRLHKVMCLKE